MNKLKAFTIVELLVVIVVIGILVSIAVVSYTGVTQRATVASAQSDLSNASKKLKIYQLENETYPIDRAAAISANLIPDNDNYYYYVDNTTTPQTFCISYINTDTNVAYSINQNGSPIPAPYCPVLYLDASNPNSYPGAGTTWYDLSGFSNNGTLTNGPTFTSDNGGVFIFDGVNDYVNVGNIAVFDIIGNITLEAWVKTTQATYGGILTKYNVSTLSYGYDLGTHNNSAAFNIRSGVNGFSAPAFSAPINDGGWHHITGVFNGNNIVSYKDGIAGSLVNWSFSSSPSISSLQIGARGGGNYFNGQVGGARIYSRALLANEVIQNFNNQKARYGL